MANADNSLLPRLEKDPVGLIKEQFLAPCDLRKPSECVDERWELRGAMQPRPFGPKKQGGTYAIIDALKSVTLLKDYDPSVAEEGAWRIVAKTGLPVGVHVHAELGELGCGYANKVENDPASVGAPHAVTAEKRLVMARIYGAQVLVQMDEHKPDAAVINWIPNTTVHHNKAFREGLGIFCLDAWPLMLEGRLIAQAFPQIKLDPRKYAAAIIDGYEKTIQALAGHHIHRIHDVK